MSKKKPEVKRDKPTKTTIELLGFTKSSIDQLKASVKEETTSEEQPAITVAETPA